MRGPRRTRPDVQPWTWEVPAAVTAGWLILVAVALPAGQGLASFAAGHGWVWPTDSGLMPSIGGLLTGHPGMGLAVADAAKVPGTATVYLAVVVAEAVMAAASVWVFLRWWNTTGPGAREGLAHRGDVERVLGLSRVRRDRKVIRPDLYGDDAARCRRRLSWR